MRIAITGANGHVGANLCRLLIQDGHYVRPFLFKDSKALHGLNLIPVKGNVLDKESLRNLIQGCDIVFHLAAQISISANRFGNVYDINVHGTDNVIDVSLEYGVKRLIHFSSIHAFSQFPLDSPLDENRDFIRTSGHKYDISKAESETLIKNAVCNKGLNAIILNPTSIIGINDFKPSLMGQVLIKLFNRSLPALVPGGYDWVDVRDVCLAAVNAMSMGNIGENYILSGHWVSLKKISDLIRNLTGIKATRIICPSILAKMAVPFFTLKSKLDRIPLLYTFESLDILKKNNQYINSNKAQSTLDYNVRPFNETILDTFQWFSRNGYLK